jgi:hypothetical protein
MARSPDMAELLERHDEKLSALLHEFLRLNPTIDLKDADTWTLEQAEEWRRAAAPLSRWTSDSRNSTGVFEFCSGLVDLVVCVRGHGGGGHRLALAGERLVGRLAEDIAEVGDRGVEFGDC